MNGKNAEIAKIPRFFSRKSAGEFEKRFFRINYPKLVPTFVEPVIHCLCLTSKHASNEDAMWRMYAKPGLEMIKADYKITSLLKELDTAAQRNHFSVFVGQVVYLAKKDILSLKPSKIKNFNLETYLTLLCLKRLAYSYEYEVRFFVVPKYANA